MSRKHQDADGGWQSPPRAESLSRAVRVRETFVIEDARNEVTNIGLVIDNQNVTGHGSTPVLSAAKCRWLHVYCLISWSRLPPRWSPPRQATFVSSTCGFASAGSAASLRFQAPGLTSANRSRIQAPRCPGRKSFEASLSSMRPPWSSSTLADDGESEPGALLARRHIGLQQAAQRLTFGRPIPLSITSITMSSFSRAAITSMRPLPSSSGGTCSIASVAFLMMLVSACGNQPAVELRADRILLDIGRSISRSGWPTLHQEYRLPHGVGDVLAFHDRLWHPCKSERIHQPSA